MYNPFMSGMMSGMKSPQQYQQELNQLQQQYTTQYNQIMGNQMNNQYTMPNCFGWKYIDNANEVDTAQVPTNGNPFLFIGNGIMYMKKWQNGQAYIQAYSFAPINQNGVPKGNEQENIESGSNDLKTMLDKILATQQEFNCRLSSLEDRKVKEKVKAEVVDNPFKEKKDV